MKKIQIISPPNPLELHCNTYSMFLHAAQGVSFVKVYMPCLKNQWL